MNYTLQKDNHYLLFSIAEEKLNTLNAPELKSEIVLNYNTHGINNYILDLSQVKYIDSSGLSAILVANRLCNESNKTLVLAQVQEAVMDLVNISQLNKVLTITPTVQEAKDLIVMNEIERSIIQNTSDDEAI